MKIYTIPEPNRFEIKEVPDLHEIGPEEVLMKVHNVGICGSDIHIYHGTNPFATYPRVWGHEFAGTVVETGNKVENVKRGDHIVAEPFISCGKCYACRHGRGNVCEKLSVFGVHQDGGCREYILIHKNKVHVVPKEVPWELAALAEPLTIGFQATARGRVEDGDLVLVMGAGTIGLTCLMAAKAKGARVVITDLYDNKLAYAAKFGADYLVNVREKKIQDFFEEFGEKPNVILDGVCTKRSLEEAVEMVSAAGRIVELGYAEICSEISHKLIMQKEVDVCGTRLQSGRFGEAIRYIVDNQEKLDDFVNKVFSVDELTEAFAYVTDNPAEVRKAQILMERG